MKIVISQSNFTVAHYNITDTRKILQYSVPFEAYFSESTAFNQCHSNFNVYEYEFKLLYVLCE